MTKKQCREILDNLKQINRGLDCIIVGQLCSNRITNQKTSFEYLDLQIESLREYINGTAKIINKELES